jgi:hypothetical protein
MSLIIYFILKNIKYIKFELYFRIFSYTLDNNRTNQFLHLYLSSFDNFDRREIHDCQIWLNQFLLTALVSNDYGGLIAR